MIIDYQRYYIYLYIFHHTVHKNQTSTMLSKGLDKHNKKKQFS